MATEEKAEGMEVEETKTEIKTESSEQKVTEKKEVERPVRKRDPYAKDDAETHYRVKISGLPRFYTPSDPLLVDFKRLLSNEFGLDFKYIRSPKKGNSWLYITFHDQDDQAKALKLLKHYSWKGRTLISTLVVADVLKRKQEDGGQESSKRPRLDIPVEEQMLMSTIPYHTVSYEEQLAKKNEEAECLFKWLAECLEKKAPKLIGYIDEQIAKNKKEETKDIKKKIPFKLDEVRKSTVIDGYRNKCEFRIGTNPQTKEIVVGYRVDNQEGDNIAVAPPDTLRHLPPEMIAVVKVFEKYVRVSPFPPQIVNHDTGVWRLLHVRINRNKELMVVVLINPTVLSDDELAQMKKDLIEYFTVGEASQHNVISLYFHTDNDVKVTPTLGGGDPTGKMKKPQGELELLWGKQYMEEKLLDLDLDIDPNFYFQNNTWGAEELYKAVMELACVDDETTVLDLCCGSGGMGMMMAKHCKEVIGVEVMDVNVDDAKRLAAKNGLTNCEFLQGAVDDLMPVLEEKLKGKKVVPILDPPRVGISLKLIASLRKMKEVQRIIYVCSNHKMPSKNIMDMAMVGSPPGWNADALAYSRQIKDTDPFFPTRVIPVDISPHALRCELVICLERIDMAKVPIPKRSLTSSRLSQHVYHGTYSSGTSNGREGRDGRRGDRDFRRGDRDFRRDRGRASRDSLYPPPLRQNLYPRQRDSRDRSYRHGGYEDPPMRRSMGPHQGRGFGQPRRGPPDFDNGLNRYSDFRRDVEEAIDSSYPVRSPASRRLAVANAMLEKGLRLAEEAMAEEAQRPRLIRRRPMMMEEEEMPPPPMRRRAPPMAMEDEFDQAWGRPAPVVARRRLPPPVEVEDFGMSQPFVRRRVAPPPLLENESIPQFVEYPLPPGPPGGIRRGRGGAWGPPPAPVPPPPKPEEQWASTWDGEDYVIVPPAGARQPPRGRGGLMRGTRGTANAMRGFRGQNTGGVWRH